MLVAIIGIILVGFIVLVEPSERAALLDGTDDSGRSGTGSRGVSGAILLRESPGKIDFLDQDEVDHPLPVVTIFTKTESRVITQKSSAFAKKSLFSEELDRLTFRLGDVSTTENVLLVFEAVDTRGRLTIILNGERVFSGELVPGSSPPILLPKNLLEEENELVFEMSSPGGAFWATNRAALENIKVVADVTDLEAQSSSHVFLVSETEKKNLQRIKLRFKPDCRYGDVGPLRILVNNDEIYNAIPDCDIDFVPIEVSPEVVQAGENRIIFYATRGTYVLSHVTITSELVDIEFPTYYFELTKEQFEDVAAGRKKVKMTMDFVDVASSKFGEIVFNGKRSSFDTRDVSVSFDVSKDVLQGENSIKVKPRKTLEVRELRIEIGSS